MRGPGVYILRNSEGAALYIGQSECLDDRLSTHMGAAYWRNEIASIETFDAPTKHLRMCTERELIRNLKPKYNKMFAKLLSNLEVRNFAHVWEPNWFYDGVREKFEIATDFELSIFLGVTQEHIILARLKMMGVSEAEMRFVANRAGINMYGLKRWLPRTTFLDKPRIQKNQTVREFTVPCISRSIAELAL